MILLAFAAFLRYDDLCSLRCNDIVFYDDHLSLNISKNQTDRNRRGNVVVPKGVTIACPFTMLHHYLAVSGRSVLQRGYLFKPSSRSDSVCRLIYKDKRLRYTSARECTVGRLKEV